MVCGTNASLESLVAMRVIKRNYEVYDHNEVSS